MKDLSDQSEEYSDLDYLPMSRDALDKFISWMSFPNSPFPCECSKCRSKISKKDDRVWTCKGKPIKVVDA